MTTPASDLSLVAVRAFDAPRELVWSAFSQPHHLAAWWGPKGFTNTIREFSFRPGGEWKYVMHGPDGKNYPNSAVFVDIHPVDRLVLDHVSAPRFRLTFTLEAEGASTRVTMHQRFERAADFERMRPIAEPANHENLRKLADHVGAMPFFVDPIEPTIAMTRLFRAPRRQVFEAMTQPEHLARWWGPARLTLQTCEVDLRPGGRYRFVLRDADGKTFPFGGEYREVAPPERLVFTERFEPIEGAGELVTVTLEDLGGLTVLSMVERFDSVAARDGKLAHGARDGSLESWDRLAALVEGR